MPNSPVALPIKAITMTSKPNWYFERDKAAMAEAKRLHLPSEAPSGVRLTVNGVPVTQNDRKAANDELGAA